MKQLPKECLKNPNVAKKLIRQLLLGPKKAQIHCPKHKKDHKLTKEERLQNKKAYEFRLRQEFKKQYFEVICYCGKKFRALSKFKKKCSRCTRLKIDVSTYYERIIKCRKHKKV